MAHYLPKTTQFSRRFERVTYGGMLRSGVRHTFDLVVAVYLRDVHRYARVRAQTERTLRTVMYPCERSLEARIVFAVIFAFDQIVVHVDPRFLVIPEPTLLL